MPQRVVGEEAQTYGAGVWRLRALELGTYYYWIWLVYLRATPAGGWEVVGAVRRSGVMS
jgi:hypothetical protein